MTLRALYLDFNSYFASVEQHLRPELRGKPVGVLPVMAETTCCIAASYEAKKYGVKTGTRVKEARQLCPDIILVEGRPELYVKLHHKLIAIVESCTPVERVLSIDEMVCKLTGSQQSKENALALAMRIKQAIQQTVGPQIRSSIGIAPNTFLAKLASNMQKPDGLVVLEASELPERLYALPLSSLNGVGRRMEKRLNNQHISTMHELYALNRQQLASAWGGIEGERLYDKLRGLEYSEQQHARRSLGHSHVLPPELRTHSSALSVLHRLLQKACLRMRSYGLATSGVSLRVTFFNRPNWVMEARCNPSDDTLHLTHVLEEMWKHYPSRNATPQAVGISLGKLSPLSNATMDLFHAYRPESLPAPIFTGNPVSSKLNSTLDKLNMRYGKNTVYFGGAHDALQDAPLRIAFNHIPDVATEGDTPKRVVKKQSDLPNPGCLPPTNL